MKLEKLYISEGDIGSIDWDVETDSVDMKCIMIYAPPLNQLRRVYFNYQKKVWTGTPTKLKITSSKWCSDDYCRLKLINMEIDEKPYFRRNNGLVWMVYTEDSEH